MKKLILAMLTVAFTGTSVAEDQFTYCTGKIEDWDVTKYGYFYVDGDWNDSIRSRRMCSIYGKFDDVPGEVCQIWVSTVMAAQARGAKVKLKYIGVGDCSDASIGTWSDTKLAPEYIRVYTQ